jgi:hypothetical protein
VQFSSRLILALIGVTWEGGGEANVPPIFFVSRNNFLLVIEVKRGK